MAIQNLKSISLGPMDVQLYNETLGGCFAAGCLETVRLNFGRAMRPIVCNSLDGVDEYRPLDPSVSLSYSAKELSAIMLAHGLGDGATIVPGASIDTIVGNPAADSSVAAPAEWHVVRLSAAAGPWDFSLTLENRDLRYAASTFVKGTDIEVYTAANTNGNTNVAASAWTYVASPGPYGASGSFSVLDACLGKLDFHSITDASVTQWTWDDTAPPFTINGTRPIIESDVRHGDTVALIGVSYKWGKVTDAAGVDVPAANRSKIQVGRALGEPIGIKGIHYFEKDRQKKALILRIWKARNMTGASLGFESQATRESTLDMAFMGIKDERNHPESPLFELEMVDSLTTLDPLTFLTN